MWSSFKNSNNKIFTYCFYFCTHTITVLVKGTNKFLIVTHITIIKATQYKKRKKITKKVHYFPKFCILGFLQVKCNVKGVNDYIYLLQYNYEKSSLYLNTKNARKTNFKITTKENLPELYKTLYLVLKKKDD